jgi:hypothetical protein
MDWNISKKIDTLDPQKCIDLDPRSLVKVTIHIMIKTGK